MTKRFSFLRRSSALSWRLNLLLCSVIACAILVLCVHMLRAQSAGAAWRQILPDSLPTKILRITANDSAVFAVGRLAVYRVENNRLVPFTLPNQRYPIMYATRSFHFAIIDSNLWRSRNGRDWSQVGILPSSIFFLNIVASENEKLHYATTRNGIYRSGDSGRTWQSTWLQGIQTWNIGIVADTIYAGGGCGSINRSIDGGKTWEVERFPYLGSEVYCAYKMESFLNGVYILLTSLPPVSTLYRYNGATDISSRKEEVGYINRHWGLTKTFTTRKGEILRVVVNFDEQRQAILRSTDGQKWDSLTTNGLANTSYYDGIAANSQSLFITTNNGLSLYTLDAPTTTVAVREPAPFTTEWRINYQPTNNALQLTVQLPSAAHVRCTLHTALGQEIATLADNTYAAGAHEITTTLQGMASGLYLCRLAVGGRVVGSKSVIVTR